MLRSSGDQVVNPAPTLAYSLAVVSGTGGDCLPPVLHKSRTCWHRTRSKCPPCFRRRRTQESSHSPATRRAELARLPSRFGTRNQATNSKVATTARTRTPINATRCHVFGRGPLPCDRIPLSPANAASMAILASPTFLSRLFTSRSKLRRPAPDASGRSAATGPMHFILGKPGEGFQCRFPRVRSSALLSISTSITPNDQTTALRLLLVTPPPAPAPYKPEYRKSTPAPVAVSIAPTSFVALTETAAFASPKSSTLTTPSGGNLNVGRLQIPTRPPPSVSIFQRLGDLPRIANASGIGNRPLCIRSASVGPSTTSMAMACTST